MDEFSEKLQTAFDPTPWSFFSPKIHQNLVLQSSLISLITTIITMIVCEARPKSGLICIYKYNTHTERPCQSMDLIPVKIQIENSEQNIFGRRAKY